jgi:hypothetical protein
LSTTSTNVNNINDEPFFDQEKVKMASALKNLIPPKIASAQALSSSGTAARMQRVVEFYSKVRSNLFFFFCRKDHPHPHPDPPALRYVSYHPPAS